MKIEIDKMITLENDEKYIVLENVLYNDQNYYYIARVNDDETDIKEEYKIIKGVNNDEDLFIEEVIDEEDLKILLPLFLEKMPD